jgi:Ca2+/Na+ antiporter
MPQEQVTWLRKILFPFYIAYDTNGDRTIDKEEFKLVLSDLGESQAYNDDKITNMFMKADKDASGKIEFDEFVATCAAWALDPSKRGENCHESISKRKTIARYLDEEEEPDEDDEDGDEDVPEDIADLSPAEQQRIIICRSCYQMGLGTLMVLIFSDPMVDILSEIGNRTGVSSFYIAFVLAPLASNASELIAAYNYAQKKTQKSMAISLSTLCGAGCMNNTFCLAIFMGLVYCSGLAWQFTAETISIIVVQIIVGVIVLLKRVQTLLDACLIFGLYPLSLLFVWFLENKVGLD